MQGQTIFVTASLQLTGHGEEIETTTKYASVAAAQREMARLFTEHVCRFDTYDLPAHGYSTVRNEVEYNGCFSAGVRGSEGFSLYIYLGKPERE